MVVSDQLLCKSTPCVYTCADVRCVDVAHARRESLAADHYIEDTESSYVVVVGEQF